MNAIGMLLCLSSCFYDDTQNQARPSTYYAPPSNYGAYRPPSSRYYSNPYAFPPQNAYYYYDTDQYYTPPSYYGGPDNPYYPSSSSDIKY